MNIFLYVLSVLLLVSSIPLYYRFSGGLSINRLNLISYFFYSTVVLTIIGALIFAVDIDSHYLSRKLVNKEIGIMYLLIISIVFWAIAILLNVFSNSKYFEVMKSISIRQKIKQQFFISDNNRMFKYFYNILVIISLLSVVYTFYVIGIDRIPLIRLLQGASSDELAILRQEVGRNFEGVVYIKNLFGLGLTPLLSYIAFVGMFKENKKNWILPYIITTILTVLILTYDLQKAPLLRYIFAYVFMVPYVFGSRFKIGIKHIIVFSLILIVMFVSITSINFSELLSFNSGPLNRIFKSQSFSVLAHFDVFPNRLEYLGLKGLPSVVTKILFGEGQIRSSRVVMEVFNPEGIIEGSAGVLNGLFVAEAYALFSYPGILLSIVIVAFELCIIESVFLKSKKTVVSIAAYAYIVNLFVNTTQGGFVDLLYNPVLFVIIVLVLMLQYLYTKKGGIV